MPATRAVEKHPVSSQPEGAQVLAEAESVVGPLDSYPSRSAPLSDGTFLCYSSEVGAVCISSASTDLCGGRRVTGLPTAITTRNQWPFCRNMLQQRRLATISASSDSILGKPDLVEHHHISRKGVSATARSSVHLADPNNCKLIINKQTGQWGLRHDQASAAVRFGVAQVKCRPPFGSTTAKTLAVPQR